jgi:hypothetical protein
VRADSVHSLGRDEAVCGSACLHQGRTCRPMPRICRVVNALHHVWPNMRGVM